MSMHPPLSLGQLAAIAQRWGGRVVAGDTNVVCRRVVQDSRRVTPGSLFAVRKGQLNDGYEYVASALERGAVALLVESSEADELRLRQPQVPLLAVNDWAAALGPLAHAALDYPSRAVNIVGVTGTNGKTTIAGLVRQGLERVGRQAASLGTLGYEWCGNVRDLGMTTPPADLVAELLDEARGAGVTELVMEVSSHALSLGRVDGVEFQAAGYVNLTQDHLDFHGTFASYAAAKRKLFTEGRTKSAVINIDDPELESVFRSIEATFGERLFTVGRDSRAKLRLVDVDTGLHGSAFTVEFEQRQYTFHTQLLGLHNVSNWLVAFGLLLARGVTLERLQGLVPEIEPAPGRLQRCNGEADDITVVVDYAHTPDALERALHACKALNPAAVWCVFGCGGDRDRGKRPIMGQIAARLADHVIVTNDNPRTEQALDIAHAIVEGIGTKPHSVILERRAAIDYAVASADPSDLVLIAGKGHEDYQIFGHQKVHFDDRQEAVNALTRRRTGKDGKP
jgi:UDP-N-acetylmuramoyl-L-alanyl-D-glutamate--2,6-diaminopimelate ligase